MFFKKKKSNDLNMKLDKDQFCAIAEISASDVTHKFCVNSNADYYTLLYRGGRFLGMPCPYGDPIYPFSTDPRRPGSKKDKKNYRSAKIVCLSKDFNLKVYWGSNPAFVMEDPISKKAYEVGARGVFYVNIDPTDAARSADQFYNKCLTQTDANNYNTNELRNFLLESFNMRIGAKIQEFINEEQRSLDNYVGLTPVQILKISEKLTPKIKDIFASYGLSIVVESTEGSLLQALEVRPLV